MAYYPQYQAYPPYYGQPVPDQLTQLRQNQFQQQPIMTAMQQAQGPQMAFQQPVDDRIWVQGESAATAYLVTANGFVRLWDSTQPVFYEKQADAQGKPLPMVIYDYKRRGDDPSQQVTVPDYESRLEAIEKRLEAVEKKRASAKSKEVVEE